MATRNVVLTERQEELAPPNGVDEHCPLSRAAEQDIVEILTRTQEEFGDDARQRYAALIVAAIRHAADHRDGVGFRARPELVPARATPVRSHERGGMIPPCASGPGTSPDAGATSTDSSWTTSTARSCC
ncbi:type II toxin-antitoxin system RelE/ParE family toxin [Nocardioides sp. GY 10113]|uniref:type II toxin-antitoxin system RelE/ParE family toxin n=1 Tax=Nocardioides sp. GY 10113 TaxID=2569761 RepID=UPI0010A80114|nr:type II toxin-antitoxin system RelE/ParE family toxin [Nocardioides sp. GY 10113]TIC79153.1 type II toxin-antitoxin system RelE/ParE family toxin [Nocardioides sp. GY 10113]